MVCKPYPFGKAAGAGLYPACQANLLTFFLLQLFHPFPELVHGLVGRCIHGFAQRILQRGHPARIATSGGVARNGIHDKVGTHDEQDDDQQSNGSTV